MKRITTFSRKLANLSETRQRDTAINGLIQPSQEPNQAMQELIKGLSGLLGNQIKPQLQMETRDVRVFHPIPALGGASRKQSLQKWVSEMAKKVISTSFQLFSSKELDEKKTKIFCSENILANILKLSEREELSPEDFEVMNSCLSITIGYFLLKYPQSESSEVNQKLNRLISHTNTINSNDNNLLLQSQIQFRYRKEGNYNDLIMKFINYVVDIVDEEDEEGMPMFLKFQELVEGLFESVTSRAWMEEWVTSCSDSVAMKSSWHHLNDKMVASQNQAQQNEQIRIEHEEHENKVKEYTKWSVGRKVSENTEKYSVAEIENGNMRIKSPAFLRILTKWCEELEKYFTDTEHIIMKHAEEIIMQDGNSTGFTKNSKKIMIQLIEEQKQAVQDTLSNIRKNNYQFQSSMPYRKLKEDQEFHIEEDEKVMGKFACKNIRCLETYLIVYLNSLIHGLVKASQNFHNKYGKVYTNWSAPPVILSFTIGDLIRCKCSSQEKETIRIYRELQILNEIFPEKIKIIRVKNRLNQGTKDILINARFNNKITCEVQLAINPSINNFIYSSDKFNHYLYELKRSLFGPISEMSSIWASYDPRSTEFYRILREESSSQPAEPHHCAGKELENEELPFACSVCHSHIYANQVIISNKACRKCNKFNVCGGCQINSLTEEEIKKSTISRAKNNLEDLGINIESLDLLSREEGVPSYGIYVPKLSKKILPKAFKKLIVEKMVYLVAESGHKLEILLEYPVDQANKLLFKDNLVYAVEELQNLKNKGLPQLCKEILIPRQLHSCYKNREEAINLDEKNIDESIFENVQNRKGEGRIQFLTARINKIQRVQGICGRFPNLRSLTLNLNRVADLQGIGQCKNLLRLKIINNKVEAIPDQMAACCLKLQILSLSKNMICEVPKNLALLQYLSYLDLSTNLISTLPQQITEILTLEFLIAENNKINNLPDTIGNLINLVELKLSSNMIQQIPTSIGKLKKLTRLFLNANKIAHLPDELCEMTSLKHLYLNFNNLVAIPQQIGDLSNLSILHAFNNKIQKIPSSIKNLSEMQNLSFQANQIQEVPVQLFSLSKVRFISLAWNKIPKIPSEIMKLKLLKVLHLDSNKLEQIPNQIKFLTNLTHLQCQFNRLGSFPKGLLELTKIRILLMNHNSIPEIPSEIFKLNQLRIFHIEDNQIESLPDSMKQLHLMENLGFGNKKMQSISDTIYELGGLKHLELSATVFTELPRRVYEMTNLLKLDIHENCIQQIPDQISHLTSLTFLMARKNHISRISPKISMLKQLTELNLSFNQLTQLPTQLFSLRQITMLNISSNHLTHFPDDFSKMANITPSQLKCGKNPAKHVGAKCQDFIIVCGSKKSKQWLMKYLVRLDQQKLILGEKTALLLKKTSLNLNESDVEDEDDQLLQEENDDDDKSNPG